MNKIKKTALEKTISAREKGFAGKALKVSSEFFSAILVGALLGIVSDRYLTASPWGLIFFLALGTIAGILNVMRYAAAPRIDEEKAE